jgi:uncharacterized protein
MKILHHDTEKKGRFYTEDERAEIVYTWFMQGGIIVEHTEVDPSLEGQGVGKQLVDAVVNWARAEQVKVMPLCVFAKAVFDRKPEYADVLYKR